MSDDKERLAAWVGALVATYLVFGVEAKSDLSHRELFKPPSNPLSWEPLSPTTQRLTSPRGVFAFSEQGGDERRGYGRRRASLARLGPKM